jgi:DtxR family transcriptional regulator, Mn-dependent transcriptional regulator
VTRLSETAEEILETLWITQEEKGSPNVELKKITGPARDAAIGELSRLAYISVENGKVKLLEKGKLSARGTVRRHRLAERLMVDIFRLKPDLVNETACRFEHILQPEVEENVCILLGHPKICPHGKPIPAGRCCPEPRWTVESTIKPLTGLSVGQKGKVAYLLAGHDQKLQKLMALGVLPGARIGLVHRVPSYVFQIGHTEVAVDREMAGDIYVLLTKGTEG